MRTLLSIAAVFAVLAAVPALAQYQSPYNDNNRAQWPQGSYRNSCTNVQVNGAGRNATLTATCRDTAGNNRTSTLQSGQCVGDIGNNNGVLRCNGAPAAQIGDGGVFGRGNQGRGPQYSDGLPDGTWRQTCTEGRIDRVWVKAQCLNNAGRRVLAETNWERCSTYSYSNSNGVLVCDPNGPGRPNNAGRDGFPTAGTNDNLPAGTWRNSCSSREIDRSWVRGQCLTTNGRRVQAEANWERCASYSFSNNNGVLVCDARGPGRGNYPEFPSNAGRGQNPDYGYGNDIPSGDWRRTCQAIGLANNNQLVSAQCRDNRGNLRSTSVDMRTCRNYSLVNDDGVLRCG